MQFSFCIKTAYQLFFPAKKQQKNMCNQLFQSEVCVAALYALAFTACKGEKLVGDLNRKLVKDLNRNGHATEVFHVSNCIDY